MGGCPMNSNVSETDKMCMPPAFMATTRQKILLDEHKLPHSFFEIEHPRTMNAIHSIGNITKGIVNFARKG